MSTGLFLRKQERFGRPSTLSANMRETPSPGRSSVEGETGIEDVHEPGGIRDDGGDRGGGEGAAAAVRSGREVARGPKANPVDPRDRKIAELGPRLGVAPTCAALRLARASFYRGQQPTALMQVCHVVKTPQAKV